MVSGSELSLILCVAFQDNQFTHSPYEPALLILYVCLLYYEFLSKSADVSMLRESITDQEETKLGSEGKSRL